MKIKSVIGNVSWQTQSWMPI